MVIDYRHFEGSTTCIFNQGFLEEFQKRGTGADISFLPVRGKGVDDLLDSLALEFEAGTLLRSVGKTGLFVATVQRN
jgi:hypothetical protein